MSIQKRIDDAQFNIHTPICQFCEHGIRRKFDPNNPNRSILGCMLLGDAPPEVKTTSRCKIFVVNSESYDEYKPLLPYDFDIDDITK